MSESNIIDTLPNEMVTKIFGLLDPRSLDNAVLTCKRWRERIEELCPWPWKIDLKTQSIVKWLEFSQTTKRKCNKLVLRTIGSTDDALENVVEIIKIHGNEIIELFVCQCCWSIKFFVTIINHLPKLKYLIFMSSELEASEWDVQLPELKALKTLQLVNTTGFGLIDCLSKSHLGTIQIHVTSYCNISPKSLKYLLKSQKNLKTLSLRFQSYEGQGGHENLLGTLDDTLPFKLTNLSLQFGFSLLPVTVFEKYANSLNSTNLPKFIETQSKTVKSLESMGNFSNYYYESVLSKFSNLKSLRISISDLPRDPSFYERLQAKNITTLNFVETFSRQLYQTCPTYFQNFIRCVPNITDLTVDVYYCHEVMTFLSNNLKHVEKLSIRDIVDYNRYHTIQFPELHTLNIKEFQLDASWYEFVKNNTQLRDLTVNIIRNDSAVHPMEHIKKFIDSIEPLRLQKLSIGKRYPTVPIVQSTRNIFDELPFRDNHSFNHWMDPEFWTDEECFGSLLDKWIYGGRNSRCDERDKKPFGRTLKNSKGYVENVFVELEKDLKEHERMAVTADDLDTPFTAYNKR